MAGGVDVNIGADTREFGSAVRSGMIAPVEDAQGALDDYVRAADDGGEQLTDTFRRQQRQTEDLKQDIVELNRTIQSGSGPAYRKAGTDADTFKRKTTEGFDEIKESARSNAIEVGASFTGGFDQAIGGLQGFVAEFLAGFGPAGIVAGVGAAALLGTITQAITDGQEAAEAQKQAIRDLTGEYIDAGGAGKRSFDQVTDAIRAMATSDGSDVAITLQKAWEESRVAGADYQQIVQSIATGSVVDLAKARDAVLKLQQANTDNTVTVDAGGRVSVRANQRQVLAVGQLRVALEKAQEQQQAAARGAELAAKAGLSGYQRSRDLLNQLAQRYDDAATGADAFNKKTGEFQVAKFLSNMQKVRAELAKYNENLAKADLSPAAEKFLESQGAESAAAMLRGYLRATPKQKAQLNEVWSTAGDQSANTYEDAIGKSLKGITLDAPKLKPPVVPAPDTSALDRFYRTAQPRIRIGVDLIARNGQRIG